MKQIKFDVLGIETQVSRFKLYSDDGFQDNLVDYTEIITKKYEARFPNKKREDTANADGICIVATPFFGLTPKVHIGYLDAGDDLSNIISRAHEETHALEELGKIKLLENIIFEKYGEKLELKKTNRETRAHIGSFYALAQYPCFSFLSFRDCILNIVLPDEIRDGDMLRKAYDLFSNTDKKSSSTS